MKTYTFKIKLQANEGLTSENEVLKAEHPCIVTCIHCPLEVFFDSFKASKELYDFCKKTYDDGNDTFYVTVSDFVSSDGVYYDEDFNFCHITALLESNSLKDLLTHPNCYGVLL